MSEIIYRTLTASISIRIKNNEVEVIVHRDDSTTVASFGIELIWDMLKDHLLTLETDSLCLRRRIYEARAAVKATSGFLKKEYGE